MFNTRYAVYASRNEERPSEDSRSEGEDRSERDGHSEGGLGYKTMRLLSRRRISRCIPTSDGREPISRARITANFAGFGSWRLKLLTKSRSLVPGAASCCHFRRFGILKAPKRSQDHSVWYLFMAKHAVWYPPPTNFGGLVPKKFCKGFRDQAFLQQRDTKPPKMAETREPNPCILPKMGLKTRSGYQIAYFGINATSGCQGVYVFCPGTHIFQADTLFET